VHEGLGRNPHVHLLLSTSLNDGIDRPVHRWFRRFNARKPADGGARSAEYVTKRRWVFRVRETWAKLANAALRIQGRPANLDHRSNLDRGLLLTPQIHLGPHIAHLAKLGITTPRSARRDAIDEENRVTMELHASLQMRRSRIWQFDQELAILNTARLFWDHQHKLHWRDLLAGHPLAADFLAPEAQASLLILESSRENIKMRDMTLHNGSSMRIVEGVSEGVWDVVPTGAGIWLVLPHHDTLVVVGPGHAATDAVDAKSIRVMFRAAAATGFTAPVVVVRRDCVELTKEVMGELGLSWRMELMPAADSGARRQPPTSRSRNDLR
jgi:hypothetical protein